MPTANTFRTDLNSVFNIVQNTAVVHPKEVFIESLRNFFSQDSFYRFVADEWGFPKTPDVTDFPNDAGINDDLTTRLFIGETYRYDMIFYPAILVKNGGGRFVPISFNNNEGVVHYRLMRFIDGYGNESFTSTPDYIKKSGAWEGSINIDIEAHSHRARDELTELVKVQFIEVARIDLQNAGVFVKGVRNSGPSETDDRNGKLYKDTVTCEIRSEWAREIPVQNAIDAINLCVDFGNLDVEPEQIAPNLRVSTTVELSDTLMSM